MCVLNELSCQLSNPLDQCWGTHEPFRFIWGEDGKYRYDQEIIKEFVTYAKPNLAPIDDNNFISPRYYII